jgi:hypothetical protein
VDTTHHAQQAARWEQQQRCSMTSSMQQSAPMHHGHWRAS